MKTTTKILAGFLPSLLVSATAMATNGDNLMGIGPKSRAMGGVGIANPQDAISAVFENPAAMCITPVCSTPVLDFGGTLFMPHIKASLRNGDGGSTSLESSENVYAIPAIGISLPIGANDSHLRFGLAAYGVSGLGVDYRGSSLDGAYAGFGGFPRVAAPYTSLMIMKFAPSLAYQVTPNFSVGAALHLDYATLDLGNGGSTAYGIGAQPGVSYRFNDRLVVGAMYISPQNNKFTRVMKQPTGLYDLNLEAPQTVGAGIGYDLVPKRLMVETDFKWVNWSGARGYKDFDWQDQYVAGVGVQFKAIPDKLTLRAGYNYGNNPVKQHDGWTGADMVTVQGITMPKYYYETFRVIGFPAIVEHHVSIGVGYEFSQRFSANAGYTHAFSNSITENGGDFAGATTIKSTLSEDSVELGLSWSF